MLLGTVSLLVAIDPPASAEIVTVPLLLMGLGVGALASQLGSVTVSAVPDELSAEVGGLQNTATNLGASLGTALIGSILIASLTSTFLTGIQANPQVPAQVTAAAQTQLADGIPFMSNAQLTEGLTAAGVPDPPLSPIVAENATARLIALQTALGAIAAVAVIALFFTGRIPTEQPRSQPA
jgi:hypothetical protein